MSFLCLLEAKINPKQRTTENYCHDFFGGGEGLVGSGGALLVGVGSVCDDLGGVSTGDEVMLTSHPELAHCAPTPPRILVKKTTRYFNCTLP